MGNECEKKITRQRLIFLRVGMSDSLYEVGWPGWYWINQVLDPFVASHLSTCQSYTQMVQQIEKKIKVLQRQEGPDCFRRIQALKICKSLFTEDWARSRATAYLVERSGVPFPFTQVCAPLQPPLQAFLKNKSSNTEVRT